MLATDRIRAISSAEAGASSASPDRSSIDVERAEEAGLVFAFRARCLAVPVVGCAVLVLAAWPRNLYYLGFAAGFLLLGYVPFRLRRHPAAERIKLGFVVLDVALITAAVLQLAVRRRLDRLADPDAAEEPELPSPPAPARRGGPDLLAAAGARASIAAIWSAAFLAL